MVQSYSYKLIVSNRFQRGRTILRLKSSNRSRNEFLPSSEKPAYYQKDLNFFSSVKYQRSSNFLHFILLITSVRIIKFAQLAKVSCTPSGNITFQPTACQNFTCRPFRNNLTQVCIIAKYVVICNERNHRNKNIKIRLHNRYPKASVEIHTHTHIHHSNELFT